MKLRLILMGCILTVLSIIFMIVRGYSEPLIGLLIVGIILTVVGFAWKPKEKTENPQ
jgi:hypothetical protein